MRTQLLLVICLSVACGKSSSSSESSNSSSETASESEAVLNLRQLEQKAKAHYNEQAAFPSGSAGPTGCEAGPSKFDAPVWQALGFQIDEPTKFKYSYQSDGKTFSGTAEPCAAGGKTHRVEGHLVEGNPVVSYIDE